MVSFTKKQILQQLKDMRTPQDKVVLVHISLKAVGSVEGRAQGLLDAFIEYFTEKGGVLCIPTHTWHNTFSEIVLDKNDPVCCIGKFSEIAAKDKRGIRTSNPTHSMVLFGDSPCVQDILRAEEQIITPTAEEGAYGKLYDGGYVLLIGVGQDKNTYLHSVEEKLEVPNRLSETPITMQIKHEDGRIQQREFYYIQPQGIGDVSTKFPKYEPAFRYYNGIVDGYIGRAKAQLCNAKILADTVELIRQNSLGIELLADENSLKEQWYKSNEQSNN